MITSDTLKAQHIFYTTGRQQAVDAFKKAEASVNAFNGAIEVLDRLMELDDALEKTKNSSDAEVAEVKTK